MPGKLLDSSQISCGGALGLLASAYANSESDEDEKDIGDNPEFEENSRASDTDAKMEVFLNAEAKDSKDLLPLKAEIIFGDAVQLQALDESSGKELTLYSGSGPKEAESKQGQAMIAAEISQQNKDFDNASNDKDIQIISCKFKEKPFTAPRGTIQETDSDTSDSDSDSTSEEESDNCDSSKSRNRQAPRVKGEMLLSDLPPIEDLHISVPHEQCQALGKIKSVVDSLVIVESYPGSTALDLDTVLFLDKGDRALGHIFDVFGSVKHPHYCVRFNSKDHIATKGVETGMLVYCAPESEYTRYVFLAQLRLLRGTDASWQDDIEPPPEEQDYSDDEAERGKNKPNRPGQGGRGRGRGGLGRGSASRNQARNRAGQTERGQKRQANGVSNGSNLWNTQNQMPQPPPISPYVPTYVSGFYPPSMRFNNYGRCPPAAWRGFPVPPMPYYGGHHQFANNPYLDPMRASNATTRMPLNHYYSPHPLSGPAWAPPGFLQQPLQQPYRPGPNNSQ